MSEDQLQEFISHVKEASANPDFIHHDWFVKWHLELVERIALELLDFYPGADTNLVRLLVWLHDYGKILDFDNQYTKTLTAGKAKLVELGMDESYAQTVIDLIEVLDRKNRQELIDSPIEIKIVSSADGCSHLVGPFYSLFWYENSTRAYDKLIEGDLSKLSKDWNRKIVLPEARKAFEWRYLAALEQRGVLPKKFIS